jgi:hypothetical protein
VFSAVFTTPYNSVETFLYKHWDKQPMYGTTVIKGAVKIQEASNINRILRFSAPKDQTRIIPFFLPVIHSKQKNKPHGL